MEGVQKLNKLLIQFVINVLVIMFDPIRRTSNLYGGVQKLDKLLADPTIDHCRTKEYDGERSLSY
jgi:hypothetical protein